jgi:hypothetical protein
MESIRCGEFNMSDPTSSVPLCTTKFITLHLFRVKGSKIYLFTWNDLDPLIIAKNKPSSLWWAEMLLTLHYALLPKKYILKYHVTYDKILLIKKDENFKL